MPRRAKRALLLSVVGLLLAGCASQSAQDRDADGDDRDDGEAADATEPLDADAPIEHGVDNEAVAVLWERSRAAWSEGEEEQAIAALERAVRVTPDDPVLWSRLAEYRLEQGEAGTAENLAARSNALADDRRSLRYRNWLIIEAAREQQGDGEGAREAREAIDALRQGA